MEAKSQSWRMRATRGLDDLSAEQLKFATFFPHNPLPLWVYDLETLRFLDVNDVACKNYGYTRGEFLALSIRAIRPTEVETSQERRIRHIRRNPFARDQFPRASGAVRLSDRRNQAASSR
jgi:PAS domain S-box-containing protein